MFMILLILKNSEKCQPVLGAWTDAGVPDASVFPTLGLGRIKAHMGMHDDIPLMPSLEDFFLQEEGLQRTLIVIVPERADVDRILRATQSALGDLNQSGEGTLVVLPVLEAYGLNGGVKN